MSRVFSLLAPSLIAVLALTGSLQAQQKKEKGPAYTAPPKEEPCYPLMGEFIGEVATGEGETELLGLQIRPVGGDAFDAVSFMGGLPGQDKHQPKPIRMIGRRSDDFVILSGGPWAIFVEENACLLLDRKGNRIGTLDRIQRKSPTLGARPPEGATVLFDGTNIDQFTDAQMTKDGLLMEGANIKPMFQDFNLHVEFRLPYMPQAEGQSRSNSGLYLQGRYECQVLDSFALDPVYNGCGSLYRFRAPDLNMCLPPLVWQTYDIQFTAPRWAADGTKIRDAHITSWVNGVKVQDNVALPNKTGAGKQEEPTLSQTRIQDHGDPVRFRNIWVVDRGLATGDFPVYPTEEELAAAAAAEKEKEEREAAEKRRKIEAQKMAEAKKADAKKADAKKAEAKKAEAKTASEAKKMAEQKAADDKAASKPSDKQATEKANAGEKKDEPAKSNAPAPEADSASTGKGDAKPDDSVADDAANQSSSKE